MCDRCDELQERVAWLESELGLQNEAQVSGAVHAALKAATHGYRGYNHTGAKAPSHMILALYRAKGRPMTKPQLLEAVPPNHGGDDDRNPKILDVWISYARKAFGYEAIETIWGQGYRLTPIGMERVAGLLEEHGGAEAGA